LAVPLSAPKVFNSASVEVDKLPPITVVPDPFVSPIAKDPLVFRPIPALV
jgi:hypothetical protein